MSIITGRDGGEKAQVPLCDYMIPVRGGENNEASRDSGAREAEADQGN